MSERFFAMKGHHISQLFTLGFLEAERWICYGKTHVPPYTCIAQLQLCFSGAGSLSSIFFFFNFKPDYQVTTLYCCCLPLFSISIPYFISVCFSWDLLLATHLLSTSHFADALVNLFYFSSKSLLKVLGIMSK